MNWKAKEIFHLLVITIPSQEEIAFVESTIEGGKSDNMEKAKNICAFLKEEGKEQEVYDKLRALTGNES